MKKITTFVLLICLFFTVMGYHFVFGLRIHEAKAEMKKQLANSINSSDVVELSFTPEKAALIEWENDHEFRYGDEMYDLLQKRVVSGKVVLRCIPDEKETALVNEYLKANRRNRSESQSTISLLQLAAVYFIPSSTGLPEMPEKIISISFPTYTSAVFSSFAVIHLPPPKSC